MRRALEGKRIVVTRAPEQARELIERFGSLGAEVILLPAVSFSRVNESKPLDRAIAGLETFEWVLFTSANAARFFAQRCRELGHELPGTSGPLYAAVGPATAKAAAADGIRIEFVAREFRGDALAHELETTLKGKRVLLPRSRRATSDLPKALTANGANVSEVVAYETGGVGSLDKKAAETFRSGNADVVAIFSPSAVENLLSEFGAETLRQVAANAAFAAVGPVTGAAIRDAGLTVSIQAREVTAAALVEAVCEYFAAHSLPEARLS